MDRRAIGAGDRPDAGVGRVTDDRYCSVRQDWSEKPAAEVELSDPSAIVGFGNGSSSVHAL